MAKTKKQIIFEYTLAPGKYVFGDPTLIFENFNLKQISKNKKDTNGYNIKSDFYYIKINNDTIDYLERDILYRNNSNIFIIKKIKNESLLRNKSEKIGLDQIYNFSKIELKESAKLIFDFKDDVPFIFIKNDNSPGPLMMISQI